MCSFLKSEHCLNRAHCVTCRDTTMRGLLFRRSLTQTFEDITSPEFACPYGIPWDCEAQPSTIHTTQTIKEHKKTIIKSKPCYGCAERKKEFKKWLQERKQTI